MGCATAHGGSSTTALRVELVDARRLLEDIVERPVCEAACPFGSYDRRVLRLLPPVRLRARPHARSRRRARRRVRAAAQLRRPGRRAAARNTRSAARTAAPRPRPGASSYGPGADSSMPPIRLLEPIQA